MRVSRKQVFAGEAAAAAKLRKSPGLRPGSAGRPCAWPRGRGLQVSGDGLSPVAYDLVVGGRLLAKVRQDEAVRFDVLALPERPKPEDDDEDLHQLPKLFRVFSRTLDRRRRRGFR